jgi:hypothetical protein
VLRGSRIFEHSEVSTVTPRVVPTLFCCAALALATPSGTTGTNAAGEDVTGTSLGRDLAAQAAGRFTARGISTSPAELVVVKRGGEYLVLPSNLRDTGGDAIVASPADRPAPGPAAFAVAATPYWDLNNDACFETVRVDGFMTTCFHLFKLMNDPNGSYDYWTLHMFGTAVNSLANGYGLESAYVYAYRNSSSATMYWYDWDPGADSSINCSQIQLGVAYASYGLTFGHTQCETWDITRWAGYPGRFKTQWNKGFFYVNGDREAAFEVLVRVPQGGAPIWNLDWNFGTRHI